MRQIEQESATGVVEEAPQEFRFAPLRVLQGKESGNVFHYQRRAHCISQDSCVSFKPLQKFLGIKRRKHIIQSAGMILGMQTLKMFRDPRRSVHVLQPPRAIERMRTQWIGKLSQIIVQQQRKTVADVGKSGIVAGRRISHSKMSDKVAGSKQLFC